jgi:uncharacterized repeat protein (TIGR04052 family)
MQRISRPSPKLSPFWQLIPALLTCFTTGCGGDDGTDVTPTPEPEFIPQAVAIEFDARVGVDTFACGSSYDGVGLTGTTLTPSDFRFYVHDVRLVTADGEEVYIDLDQDGLWQYDRIALLDFEDKTGACDSGTREVNHYVKGIVPYDTYTGIKFILGVPFEYNHIDANTAPSPLNLTSMFWGWSGGYKFFRIDAATTGLPNGAFFHLGSTDCVADATGTIISCEYGNRTEISLPVFTPGSSRIRVDLAQLFQGTNLDANTQNTATICMSDQDDPDCQPLFARLGLSFGGNTGDPSLQTVFSEE